MSDTEVLPKKMELPPPYTPSPNPGEQIGTNYTQVLIEPSTSPTNGNTITATGEPGMTNSNTLVHSCTKEEKAPFYREVYAVLFGQGLIVLVFAIGALYIPTIQESIQSVSYFKFYGIWVLFALVIPMILVALDKFLRKPPMDMVLLAVVTLTSGLLIGSLGAYIGSEKMLIEIAIILIIFLCVIIFTFQQRYWFTPTRSVLFVWTLLAIIFGFLCIPYTPKDGMWIIIPPTVFITYAVAATHLAVRNPEQKLKRKEVIYGGVLISMYLAHGFVYGLRFALGLLPCCRVCSPLYDGHRSFFSISIA